ncbi:MAG: AAA family ATPase [Methylocella sp.]
MDFSTLEKRRRACENELAVNAANAPQLYLGVTPISRDGVNLKFGRGPQIVEWAVHLRRFDENRTLDHLADRGELDLDIIAKLADVVVGSHQRAVMITGSESTSALRAQIEETMDALEAASDIFPAAAATRLRGQMQHAFKGAAPILLKREANGHARRCHGDLHLRNIVMIKAEPVLFDALEFDERLATCDILYDLAFLLMDLWTRGLRAHANLVFNRYLSASGDIDAQLEALAALPLFLSLRAAIRAKVANLEPSKQTERVTAARHYFEAACAFFEPSRLDLVAFGGLSGSGKSSVAREIAASVGRAPGAVHLRSDIERKRLFGHSELEHLPDEAYQPASSAMTYARLRAMAATALAAGQSVVIDAANRKLEDRRALADLASRSHVRFTGLWLEAPVEIRLARVAKRTRDASDADAAIVAMQAQEPVGAVEWNRLDACGPIEPLIDQALAVIRRQQD